MILCRVLLDTMRFRILLCAFFFSSANLLKAERDLRPPICDFTTMAEYLIDIGFTDEYLVRIFKIQTTGDGFNLWLNCFEFVNSLKVSTLEKLIAILYLCAIGTVQIEGKRINLAPVIRERIKIFEKQKFYNLISSAQRELLATLQNIINTDIPSSNTFKETFLTHRPRSDSFPF